MPDDAPHVRLDDFLKMADAVATGGHAKRVIQAGEVLVNGEVETRRRRKLHAGDTVTWGGEEWEVATG